MELIYSNLVTENKAAFLTKVKEISAALGIDPNWLMHVMKKESELNSKARNAGSNATGLIQFMPTTAANLGTSTGALYNMSNVEQLEFVKKYLWPMRSRMDSVQDVYFAVFFPAAMSRPLDWVLQTANLSASRIADQNSGMDADHNRAITVYEVRNWLLKGTPQNILDVLLKKNGASSNAALGSSDPVLCSRCGGSVVHN